MNLFRSAIVIVDRSRETTVIINLLGYVDK
jgi:hypothetical protein